MRSMSQTDVRRVPNNRGFTLLEILLALSLTVALLAAVYAALDLHYKFVMSGREDVKRAQLARSLLKEIATDIRCVVYAPEEEEEAPPSEADSESETGDNTSGLITDDGSGSDTDLESIEVADPADAFAGGGVGVVGNATSLVLHISRPSRTQMISRGADDGEPPPVQSDLQSVSYFLAGEDGGTLQEMVADQIGSDVEGLARMSGDRLAMDLADANGDLQSLAARTRMLAEEVDFLQFQYLDGPDVLDEWDSKAYGRLPSAIVIEIGFRAPEATDNMLTQKVVSAMTEKYRLVVHLPLANPTDASSDY